MSMSQLYARILMSCARYHVTMAAAPGHHPTAPTAPQFLFLLPPALPLLPPTSPPCPDNISRTTYLAEQLLVILRLANSGSCKGGMKYVFLFPAHEPPSSNPNKNQLESYQSGHQICCCCVLPLLYIITAARCWVLEVR